MESQRRFWWTVGIVAMCVVLLVLIFVSYHFQWAWIGFNKSLWDWMQLLIIPVALAIVAVWFNRVERKNEQAITLDNQRAEALQAYLDAMSDLLLKEGLRQPSAGIEVRNIARARTLTVLRQLDGKRKGSVLQFLYESGLIHKDRSIISLDGADLRLADLDHTDLNEADLSGTYLNGANLLHTCLNNANLSKAVLQEACLITADLGSANLCNAKCFQEMIEGEALLFCRSMSGWRSVLRMIIPHIQGGSIGRVRERLSSYERNEVDLSCVKRRVPFKCVGTADATSHKEIELVRTLVGL